MARKETPVLMSINSVDSGYTFAVQIGEYPYESTVIKCGVPWRSKWVALRCRKCTPGGKNFKGQKCSIKIKLKNISNILEQQNAELYWSVDSWTIAMAVGKIKGETTFVIFNNCELSN